MFQVFEWSEDFRACVGKLISQKIFIRGPAREGLKSLEGLECLRPPHTKNWAPTLTPYVDP